jgi:hypothetical protein
MPWQVRARTTAACHRAAHKRSPARSTGAQAGGGAYSTDAWKRLQKQPAHCGACLRATAPASSRHRPRLGETGDEKPAQLRTDQSAAIGETEHDMAARETRLGGRVEETKRTNAAAAAAGDETAATTHEGGAGGSQATTTVTTTMMAGGAVDTRTAPGDTGTGIATGATTRLTTTAMPAGLATRTGRAG